MKSHIQNSTNHFFWDNVISRSHIALTIHSLQHSIEACYVFLMWFIFYLFFSTSLISTVRQLIWLIFGMLTRSWCNLWTLVANPQTKLWGLKTENFWAGVYSSELINSQQKRISARLKLLWNLKKWPTRCIFDLDLWPRCKHRNRL